MSETTKNLGLFKYNTASDVDDVFSIDQALNDNWDIIDALGGIVEDLELDLDNVVSKNGDLVKGNYQLEVGITKGTTPASATYRSIAMVDSQGTAQKNRLGMLELSCKTDKSINMALRCYEPTADSTTNACIEIGYDSSKNIYTKGPHCASAGAIVTQQNLSKSSNGYLKFGNGIIIQWGQFSITATSQGTTTKNLPTSFSSASSYGISSSYHTVNKDAVVDYREVGFSSLSASQVTFRYPEKSYATGCYWIAVGY